MPKSRPSTSAHEPCPFCGKAVRTSGGGISNHIARTPSCRQQRNARAKIDSHATDPFALGGDGLVGHTQGSNNEGLGMGGDINFAEHGAPVELNTDPSSIDAYNGPTPGLQVEANNDNSEPTSNGFIVYEDENAGHVFRQHLPTCFEELRASENSACPSAPWASEEEWELAKWLMSVHISQAAIDRFLKLPWVCPNMVTTLLRFSHHYQVRMRPATLSFTSAKQLHAKIQSMPGGPSWLSTEIMLKDAPNEPQLLRYRNPLECVTYLFQNPSFKDRMDFSPKWVYTADGKTRLYHEMASAEGWHAEQVHSY